ncbi:hypothetical protein [Cellulosimicrobium marinum]|uniref:hypothetical protein n=1 Tax=Cellulosimicrobium marinum TaxID=1638992 RepID=UPI001E45B430|nr:hypothetical protein [Cellulosimicrobium marinum]MCB7135991.1 hypothetical protein [Cellulosimicrobium marinum]
MRRTPLTPDSETPIFDALVVEYEQQLPLVHLGRALSGELVTVARPVGIEPRIVPSRDVPVLPRRRAS